MTTEIKLLIAGVILVFLGFLTSIYLISNDYDFGVTILIITTILSLLLSLYCVIANKRDINKLKDELFEDIEKRIKNS